MRGHLTMPSRAPEHDATRYFDALFARLDALDVGPMEKRPPSIEVDVNVIRLQFTWFHPFKGVSSAQFWVVPERDGVRIDYVVRLTGMAFAFTAVAVVAFVFSLQFPRTWWNLAGPPGSMALAFLLNAGFAQFRVHLILRDIAQKLSAMQADQA